VFHDRSLQAECAQNLKVINGEGFPARDRLNHMSRTVHLDRALARKILGGDRDAFRGLFDDFFPRLFRFAMARLDGDREAAADVVQQTFCKGIDNLDRYRGEASLYTWFCQICRNAIIDHYRATNRRTDRFVLYEDHANVRAILEALTAPVTEQPETRAWQRDIRRLVQSTIDALPPRYGDVLEWKYVDGSTVAEIAARLGSSAKAAESLLARARAAFREAIVAIAGESDALRPPG
jgi:RNA polymerase sigma-70 factor (ECF subfamily)